MQQLYKSHNPNLPPLLPVAERTKAMKTRMQIETVYTHRYYIIDEKGEKTPIGDLEFDNEVKSEDVIPHKERLYISSPHEEPKLYKAENHTCPACGSLHYFKSIWYDGDRNNLVVCAMCNCLHGSCEETVSNLAVAPFFCENKKNREDYENITAYDITVLPNQHTKKWRRHGFYNVRVGRITQTG